MSCVIVTMVYASVPGSKYNQQIPHGQLDHG